jgi:tetratricopeptide (TPR) repeat protein
MPNVTVPPATRYLFVRALGFAFVLAVIATSGIHAADQQPAPPRPQPAQAPAPARRAATTSDAEIVSLQGSGQFRVTEAQPWNGAQVKQPLAAGQFVRTGELSRMGLVFADETQLRLNQNTVLQVKEAARPGGGDTTTLSLLSGRGWSQSKVAPKKLVVQTPSATAAIRGTDWELAVDDQGTSTLTVLSGEVEFFNDFGNVLVAANEQARAEIGKPPVKLLITNPQDRVQWVTAYSVDPLRSISLVTDRTNLLARLEQVPADSPARSVERAEILTGLGRWTEAKTLFDGVIAADATHGPALLGRAFVALHEGDPAQATLLLTRAEAVLGADHQQLLALGRAAAAIQSETFAPAVAILDRLRLESTLAQPAPYLLLADLMVYSGENPRAIEYVDEGLARFNDDDRLLAMRARVYMHANKIDESRKEVDAAVARYPQSLETRIAQGDLARREGDPVAARAAELGARELNPSDARAWFGLGFINAEREDVRRGRNNLRRAIELDPNGPGYVGELGTLENLGNNFAEAERQYQQALVLNPNDYVAMTGQAQLALKRGDAQSALDLLLRAGLLEPRYARAHLYMAVAYFRLGRIQRAREELQRTSALDEKDPLPYMLLSMIDSDTFDPGLAVEAGRTSLRLMPFLKSLNQVANNQKGSANLGSALATFGMEEWAQMLAQESYFPYWAGSHLFLGDRYSGLFNKNSEYFEGLMADPTVFGASNRYQSLLPKPGFYVSGGINYNSAFGVIEPSVTVNGMANIPRPVSYFLTGQQTQLTEDEEGFAGHIDSFTGATGAMLTPALGVFGWLTYEDLDVSAPAGDDYGAQRYRAITKKIDVGTSFKFSPTSMIWVKAGVAHNGFGIHEDVQNPGDPFLDWFEGDNGIDAQVRQSLTWGRHEMTFGFEAGKRDQLEFEYFGAGLGAEGTIAGVRLPVMDTSQTLYASDRLDLGPHLLIDGGVWVHRYRKDVTFDYDESWGFFEEEYSEGLRRTRISPRIGVVARLSEQRLFRFSLQQWMRPAAENTMAPVATAGIPVDDQLVAVGGRVDQARAQVEWAFTPRLFASAYIEEKRVTNLELSDGIKQAPSQANLRKLRNATNVNLANADLLEDTPIFGKGEVHARGFSINSLLTSRISAYGRYHFTDSKNTSEFYTGKLIPYLPKHNVVFGSTFVAPQRLQFQAQAVYRTIRYEDEGNDDDALPAGWGATLRGYWELPSKRFSIETGVDDLFSKVWYTSYFVNLKVNF